MSSPTHIIIIQVQAFIHDDKPTLGLGKETMVSFGFIRRKMVSFPPLIHTIQFVDRLNPNNKYFTLGYIENIFSILEHRTCYEP